MRLTKKYKIPFIYCWTDVWHTLIPFKPFQSLARVIEKKTLNGADVVLAANKKLKENMTKIAVSPIQVLVMRRGVDAIKLNPAIVDGKVVRDKYKINSNDTLLVFVGRLDYISGLDELIMEFSKQKNPFLKLLIVGEGDLSLKIKNMQRSHD